MATCTNRCNNKTFHGMGLATDIIRSSARALVNLVNDMRCSEKVAELRNNGEVAK